MEKATLEAMASGCVPISRNAAFRALAEGRGLEWLVPEPGADRLAACILDALDRTRADRPSIVARLRHIVTEEHSLDRLSERIMTHLAELAASRRGHPRRGRLGGIPEIVKPDRNGFLVHRGDAPALADALVRILGDRELAQRLGRGARETARDLEGTPDGYAASVRRLVEQVLAET